MVSTADKTAGSVRSEVVGSVSSSLSYSDKNVITRMEKIDTSLHINDSNMSHEKDKINDCNNKEFSSPKGRVSTTAALAVKALKRMQKTKKSDDDDIPEGANCVLFLAIYPPPFLPPTLLPFLPPYCPPLFPPSRLLLFY